jgi:hypothetical protein
MDTGGKNRVRFAAGQGKYVVGITLIPNWGAVGKG